MRDRELPIFSVVGVLVCICFSALYFFLASPAHNTPIVNQIVSNDKGVWALYETDLIPIKTVYNNKTINLKDFGFISGPKEIFFESKSTFIALSRKSPSLIQQLFEDPSTTYGLLRCETQTKICSKLSDDKEITISGAYHVAVLPSRDIVIANVNQHTLFLLSNTGQILKTAKNFRYPNVVEYFNEELWVVDTNNHRFISIDSTKDSFGEIIQTIDITDINGINTTKSYPIGLEFDGDYWYVLIANGFLRAPELYKISKDWALAEKIEQPEESEAVSFLVSDSTMWLSDFEGHLWKKHKADSKWDIVETEELKTRKNKLTAEINKIKTRDWIVSGIGILMAIFILIAGLKKSKPADKDRQLFNIATAYKEPEERLNFPPFADNKIRWLSYNEKWLKLIRLCLIFFKLSFLIITAAMIYLAYILEEIKPGSFNYLLYIYLALLFFYLITYLFIKRVANTRLGVQGDQLIISRYKKIIATATPDQLIYCPYMIYIPKAVAGIGSAVMRFYTTKSEQAGLQPFLQRGKKMSEIKMYWFLLKIGHPPALMAAAITMLSIGIVLWLS